MKQHTNNYYVRNIVKTISQISTNSAGTRSNDQKPVSYLTFSRTKHRRKNETAIKLPELQPCSVRAKTEMDQPIQSELKKSVVIISRKPSGAFITQRVKTQPSIQVWEPDIQLMTEESIVKVQPIKQIDILCEHLMFNEKIDLSQQKIRKYCNTKINEIEQFQDKSSRIVRKMIQLLKTNRERMEEKELKSRTMIDTQMVRSNLFLQAQTQYFPEQSTPSPKEFVLQQQLSAIPRKHTKFNSQITLTHQPESLKPMKSLIEAIKEKQQEVIKKPSINATTPAFPIKSKKTIKLTIECIEDQKQNKHEFYIPQYMEEDSIGLTQQQNEVIEIKDTKKSNIYSLVSKNMFNKKINKIQNLNDEVLDEFNSDKATQFTRYYLQNYVLKGINIKRTIEKKETVIKEQILKQESKLEQQQFSSIKLMESSFLKDFQATRYSDIKSLIYRCPEPFDSQNSSLISDYSDCTNISNSCDYGMKLKFLLSVNLVSPWILREKQLKFIISTISDESKNILLHQEIMNFANQVEEVIHIDYEMPHQPHLEALNRLFLRINKKERKSFIQRLFKKYELICVGVFEHQIKHNINFQEKLFIKYCFSQQNNSIMDNTSVKCYNMLKSKHQRETTNETIPKQTNLMTLSLPPATKSRSESPSNISEAKTQKNGRTEQHIPLLRNTQRKPSQRFLQVQGQNKTQSQQLILKVQNLSIVKEKEIILQKDEVKEEIKKGNKSQNSNYFKQLSMDPYSLLFRNMLIQKTKNENKTLHEKVFVMVEEHRLLDIKEIFKLETSIDINFQNEDGNTLLISASKCGAASIVDYLLKNGADVQLQNYDGQTAMDVALQNYQFETADIIYKYLKLDNKHL